MKELLNCINSISPISDIAEHALLSICTEVSFKKGHDVQPVGHTCKTLYFVKKGALRIYYFKDIIDITESFEFENAFVARVESLFSGKPSRKAIQAVEDSELVAINSIKLFELYDIHHDIERLARKIFETAYVNTVNRIESLQFHSADERYQNLLSDHPDILLRVPLKHIASYLGIAPESLSRIRAGK
jgi:CRP-like cAMP-binding protein